MRDLRMGMVSEGAGRKDDNAEAMSEVQIPKMEPRAIAANEQPGDVKWGLVYHRIQYSREHGRLCDCKACEEYLRHIQGKYWS